MNPKLALKVLPEPPAGVVGLGDGSTISDDELNRLMHDALLDQLPVPCSA
jgi:hypothetical protein